MPWITVNGFREFFWDDFERARDAECKRLYDLMVNAPEGPERELRTDDFLRFAMESYGIH